MTREDWKRSARQGGPGWTVAGVLLVLAIAAALLPGLHSNSIPTAFLKHSNGVPLPFQKHGKKGGISPSIWLFCYLCGLLPLGLVGMIAPWRPILPHVSPDGRGVLMLAHVALVG